MLTTKAVESPCHFLGLAWFNEAMINDCVSVSQSNLQYNHGEHHL